MKDGQEKNKFRYAEKCLYEYKRNLAALEVLRRDLIVERAGSDVHAQNYQLNFNFGGEPSNPVQARLIKIETLEDRIKKLERVTQPITRLINDLNSDENLEGSNNKMLYEVLKLMYFGKNKPVSIRDELAISKRSFSFFRVELVKTAIDYLAL